MERGRTFEDRPSEEHSRFFWVEGSEERRCLSLAYILSRLGNGKTESGGGKNFSEKTAIFRTGNCGTSEGREHCFLLQSTSLLSVAAAASVDLVRKKGSLSPSRTIWVGSYGEGTSSLSLLRWEEEQGRSRCWRRGGGSQTGRKFNSLLHTSMFTVKNGSRYKKSLLF